MTDTRDTVTPLATGRVTVSPYQDILSSWGNTVFDQTVNQFASVTDRDSQWTSPPNGAVCYTAGEAQLWVRKAGAWAALSPPAPLTTGGPTVWTDPNGVVWIAKAGVNGGAYRQCRDVVHARVSTNAIYSITPTPTAIPFNTIERDPLGLYTTGSQRFTCPVAGLYSVTARNLFQITAAGQQVSCHFYKNGTVHSQSSILPGSTSTVGMNVNASVILCAANDYLQVFQIATATVSSVFGDATATNATFDYIGTG